MLHDITAPKPSVMDETVESAKLMHSLRELLNVMRGDPALGSQLPTVRRLALRTMAWLLLTEFYLVIQVFPVKFFIDELSQPQPSLPKLLWIAASLAVLYVAGSELRRRTSLDRKRALDEMWCIWWGGGHRLELRLSHDWHTLHSTGEKDSLVSRNVGRIEVLVDEFLFETLPVLLKITFTTVLMFCISWPLGLVALATNIVFAAIMRHGEKQLVEQREIARQQMKGLETIGSEMTNNWSTIKSLGLEEEFSDHNDRQLRLYVDDEFPRYKRYLKHVTRQENTVALCRAMLYVTVALTWQSTALGTVVLATTWMEKSFANFGRFGNFSHAKNVGAQALKELVGLMLLKPSVRSSDNPVWPTNPKGEVVFDAVSFRYPAADDCTIDDFTLKVQPNTAIAIAGESGCGKSTVLSLLTRQNDPSKGQIRIDGIDVRELEYRRYRREFVGVVSQRPQLFSGSIMENIRLGKLDATDTECIAAAEAACAHDFIMRKGGYDSQIGENGINLSGGEQQRLAIARALVRQPMILIFDEATSALDGISQQHIKETIDSLIASRSCTIFIVAHRLSTIMSADMVAVLENGKLSQLGTHEELANQEGGLYLRLRDLELRGLL